MLVGFVGKGGLGPFLRTCLLGSSKGSKHFLMLYLPFSGKFAGPISAVGDRV